MALEGHHLLFDTQKCLSLPVDHLLHVDWLGLTRSMRPTDCLKLSRGVPSWSHDVDPGGLLNVETLTTRLNLDDEDRARWRLLELSQLGSSVLLGDGPIYPECGTLQLTLDVVHLPHKLTENESLLLGVPPNHLEEGLHLMGTPNPLLRLGLVLLRNPIQVHLGPNHTLPRPEKALQNYHVLVVETGRRLKGVLDRILGLLEDKLVHPPLVWVHIQFHILKVARRQTKTFVDLGQVILRATENVDVLDLLGHPLHEGLLDTEEPTEGHKVIHRVENWGTSDNPLDTRLKSTDALGDLRRLISNLVGLIQHHPIPLNPVEGGLYPSLPTLHTQ